LRTAGSFRQRSRQRRRRPIQGELPFYTSFPPYERGRRFGLQRNALRPRIPRGRGSVNATIGSRPPTSRAEEIAPALVAFDDGAAGRSSTRAAPAGGGSRRPPPVRMRQCWGRGPMRVFVTDDAPAQLEIVTSIVDDVASPAESVTLMVSVVEPVGADAGTGH